MKTLPFISLFALLAAPLTPTPLHGQVQPPPVAVKEAGPFRLPELSLGRDGGTPLTKVVSELSAALRAANQEVPNVLFAPGVERTTVPPLQLRNVSGTDALSLVAAAANCRLEPIPSIDLSNHGQERIAGWIFQSKAPARMMGGKLPRAAATGGGGLTGTTGEGGGAPGLALGLGTGAPSGPGAATGGFDPSGGSGFAQLGVEAGLGAPPLPVPVLGAIPGMSGLFAAGGGSGDAGSGGPVTAVYALGPVTDQTKFQEVEEALRQVLVNAGLADDKAKLAFHEKTKILIVRGSPDAHQLVNGFLESLKQNRLDSKTDQRRAMEMNAVREAEAMHLRLGEAQNQMKRLEAQLEALEGERKELLRRNEKLEAVLQKAPAAGDAPKR